jgi:outer membrane protein insertion porin family
MGRLLPLIIFLTTIALSQESIRDYEVSKIRFTGNETLSEDLLRSALQLRETPSWIFKALYLISEKLGEKSEYFDPIVFESDYLRLQQFYQDNGFFHARIDTTLAVDQEAKRVEVTFRIVEGKRSYVDSVVYRGIEAIPVEPLNEIRTNALVQKGDPFQMEMVDRELRRVVRVLADNGYVAARVDSVTARRYASTNNITVEFRFTPGEQFRFGEIRIVTDTTVAERVEPEVIVRHLEFVPGDFYSESKKIESERNLNRLGIFESAQIEHMGVPANDTARTVPIRISVRPRPFHEFSPEIGVSDENNAFNILVGIGYNNRYFLGGARNLSTRAGLQVQSIHLVEWSRVFRKNGYLDSSLVGKFDISVQMIQPYLFTNKVSLSWTISSIFEKQAAYFLPILSNRVGIAAQAARYTRLFVDWNLQRINPTSLTQSASGVLARRGLKKQFNSILTFTIQRDKRNDLFSPSEGFFYSASVEEAGLLPSVVGSVFGTQLPFSRYYKLSALGQWYWSIAGERYLILASRVRGGYAQLYAPSPANEIPVTSRFFAGGSGSVRGWRARYLGAVDDPKFGGNATVEANVELRWHLFQGAGRLLFINLPNISLVLFYDAGNVWRSARSIRGSEIAMATGVGFRWDTIAGPVRIDYGVRFYDPSVSPSQRWITQRRFFPETFADGAFHFGIGHAF